MYVNLLFILSELFDKLMSNALIDFYYYMHMAICVKSSMTELIVLSFLVKLKPV